MSLAQSYDRQFFDQHASRSLQSARIVLGEVLPLLQPRSVLDVGCGIGTWVRAAADLEVEEVLGVDGDYVDRSALLVDQRLFRAADLAQEGSVAALGVERNARFDLVMSLEVAEHLPVARAPSLVRELTELADAVLFSAALPFQFGERHVNEQWPEFWAILFHAQGYRCFDFLRDRLWGNLDVEWWYAQNILLFVRDGAEVGSRLPAGSRADKGMLARVHPQNLLTNVLSLPRRFRQAASEEEFVDFAAVQAAYAAGATSLPPLAMLTRAGTADAPDVFPHTRMEVYEPEREIAALREQVKQVEQYLRAAEDACASAEDAYAGARNAIGEHGRARLVAESRLQEAQGTIAYHYRERDELAAVADGLRGDIAQREGRIAHQAQELAAEQVRVQGLQQDVARLHGEIAAMHASTTWRAGFRLMRVAGSLPRPLRLTLRLGWRGLRALRGRRVPPAVPVPVPVPDLPPVEMTAQLPEPVAVVAEEGWAGNGTAVICKFDEAYGRVRWDTLATGIARLRRFDLFRESDYLARNEDVAESGIEPFSHFLQAGALEDRGRTDPEELARTMSRVLLLENVKTVPAAAESFDNVPDLLRSVGSIGIYVSSSGNLFMTDIAEDLARDLASVGADVRLLNETDDPGNRPATSLFVAPHEFFTLDAGKRWIRDDVLSTSFMFATEQAQTKWFQTSLPFVLMSRGVIDICAQTAQLFAETGMPAVHLLPGCSFQPAGLSAAGRRHPLFQVLPLAAQADPRPSTGLAERPLDIAFFGNSSPKRDRFFGRNAAFLADYDNFIYSRRAERGPLLGRGEEAALTRLAAHVSGHAKITLNIHREEFGYFEWHRMVRLGMCSGSVVVSDPCLPHPDFVAGTHYFQEATRHLPDLLEWLLRTEDGRRAAERVRANVDDVLSNQFDKQHTAAALLRFLAANRVGH